MLLDVGLRIYWTAWQVENLEPYFERKKKLMAKPSDLSYYNWETQTSTSNSTANFQAWGRRPLTSAITLSQRVCAASSLAEALVQA